MIEHADFLDHPQRMIERQGENHRPEAQPLGALRDRRQENAGRRRHAERRPVVFGKMVGVESRAIEQLHDRKPLLVIIRQRRGAAIQVVEDSEFHRGLRYTNIIGVQPAKARGRMRSSQWFGAEDRARIHQLVLRLDQR